MAYIFPLYFFIMVLSDLNKGNVLAYKKTAAAVLFLICCTGTAFTEGYTEKELLQNITGSVQALYC